MRLSPAPNNYPSGTRPVAVGAGVQFARSSGEFSWELLGCERSENRPLSNGRACLTADAEHAGAGWGSPQGEPATQFATDPCLTSWVNEGSAGLGSGGLTMQNRNRQGGSVAFTFQQVPAGTGA